MSKKIEPSALFRAAAERFTQGVSQVLDATDLRDEAEVEVARLEAQLAAARKILKVRQRRLDDLKMLIHPQLAFFMTRMEEEAKENATRLRAVIDEDEEARTP